MQAGFPFRTMILLAWLAIGWSGCGTTQQREATEQLLTSDAVDRNIAQIDFRALAGQTVYFDTTYLKNIKGVGFVNAEYITSSLRQQMVAAHCLLKDDKKDAEYVVEARIGTLGLDRHEVTYGMPANNFLTAASSLVPGSPPIPTLPEIALAKRNEQLAASKIGAFAYHRETGEPVWQSGIGPIRSTAKDTWILGAGPIQRGDIYGGTQFAGSPLTFTPLEPGDEGPTAPIVDYYKPNYFRSIHKEEELTEPSADQAVTNPTAQPPAPTNQAETPPTAETKPGEKTAEKQANPLDSAAEIESGLRLRFHFDEPPAAEPTQPLRSGSTLFRLDPPE